MGTGLTVGDVCTGVLDMLSQSREISDADIAAGNSAEARWFARRFEPAVRSLLRAHVWSFAKTTTEVTAASADDKYGYSYAYTIPSTYLRLLPVTHNGKPTGQRVPHKIENGVLYCDNAGPLYLTGAAYVSDPDDWDDMFVEVVQGKLAMMYAPKLTGKTNYYNVAEAAYQRALDSAVFIGAVEEWAPPPEESDVILARYT